jgi:small subunit ribosomal protein S8
MTFSDPVANMLATIRNANMRAFRNVVFPYSSFKWSICEKLEKSNFLSNCWFDKKNKNIKIKIKYFNQHSNIHEIKKFSSASRHIYLKSKEIKNYCRGRSIFFISTPFGLLTHHEALEKSAGGKLIFSIN